MDQDYKTILNWRSKPTAGLDKFSKYNAVTNKEERKPCRPSIVATVVCHEEKHLSSISPSLPDAIDFL